MTINISLPDVEQNLHPKITVLGVGGSGGNAVNNMISANLEGVDFLIANTDAQALQISKCPTGHGKIKSPSCCGQDMFCKN